MNDPVAHFYRTFAVPHLRVLGTDSQVRFGQSLFECGRVPREPEARDALISFHTRTHRRRHHHYAWSGSRLVLICAKWMIRLATSSIMQNVTHIPQRFGIQLIHQTMHYQSAFDALMQLFQITTPSAQPTTLVTALLHEKRCMTIHHALKTTRALTEVNSAFAMHPVAMAGCIARIKQDEFGIRGGTQVTPGTSPLARKIADLEQFYARAFNSYRTLLGKCVNGTLEGRLIPAYVEEGLLLSALPRAIPLERMVETFHPKKTNQHPLLSALLNYGLNVDQFNMLGVSFLGCSLLMRDSSLTAWLLSRGADVNAVDRRGETVLISAMRAHQPLKTIHLLVGAGANVDKIYPFGKSGMLAGARLRDLPLLRVLVEVGRADLKRRHVEGRTLIFRLIDENTNLWVLEYLVVGGGLELEGVESHDGLSPSQHARRLGFLRTADWIDDAISAMQNQKHLVTSPQNPGTASSSSALDVPSPSAPIPDRQSSEISCALPSLPQNIPRSREPSQDRRDTSHSNFSLCTPFPRADQDAMYSTRTTPNVTIAAHAVPTESNAHPPRGIAWQIKCLFLGGCHQTLSSSPAP